MSIRRDFAIGMTAIIGLLGLATILWMVGELGLDTKERYPIFLRLDNAAGIRAGSPVTMNGVEIGIVETTTTGMDPRLGVTLGLAIDETVRIPRDVAVAVNRDFVGDTTLALTTLPLVAGDPTTPAQPDPGFLEPGETLEATASGLLDQIAGLLDERIEAVSGAAESIQQLADTYNRVGQRLEVILTPPDDMAARGETPNVFETLATIDTAFSEARVWLGDEDLRTNARSAVARADETFQRVQAAVDEWRVAAQNLNARVDQTSERVDEGVGAFISATKQLEAALVQVQLLTEEVNRGVGTAGLLLKNPDLYRSVNDAAIRLERVLREAQLLIEKYRTEGIPIDL
jgi:ABC-type transporter Mla subunit MlaD